MMDSVTEIKELLAKLGNGQPDARDQLIEVLYRELRYIAGRHLNRERSDHTLSPTALVSEAYLALFGKTTPNIVDRSHFLALASRVMRRILVDHARSKNADRRGGDFQRVTLGAVISSAEPMVELMDIERSIDKLSQDRAHLGELLEMHYFGGMTIEECSAATGKTIHSLRHSLRYAQAWLRKDLAEGDSKTIIVT